MPKAPPLKQPKSECKHDWKPWNPCGFTKPGYAARTCRLCGQFDTTHNYKGAK